MTRLVERIGGFTRRLRRQFDEVEALRSGDVDNPRDELSPDTAAAHRRVHDNLFEVTERTHERHKSEQRG
jgi:hypothetical protein